MEFAFYLIYRFIDHKILWMAHKSHQAKRHGPIELNGIFPLIVGVISMILMAPGLREPERLALPAAYIGIILYGSVYFVVHDLYGHCQAKGI
jgi:beta-carotene 3-hydroxylase